MANNVHIGNSGEYYVAAELERRGFIVAVPMSDTPYFDILAVQESNHNNQISIQVKTNSKGKPDWLLSEKNERIIGDKIFYVFVCIDKEMNPPKFYIVPSNVVAEYITRTHREWLARPARNGQPHAQNSKNRHFNPRDVEIYRNNWDILFED